MPQKKKHASTRARRNKAATAATLIDQEPEDRSGWSVKQLRAEIDSRNGDGRPDEERISKGGGKVGMVAALLEDDYAIPALPERPGGWHQTVEEWWRDVWMSPMSAEWHPESDWHNVVVAAMHYNDMWQATSPVERQKATTLFVKMCDFLGLNPYARRRLEWTIETAREAKERGAARRQTEGTRTQQRPEAGAVDPRQKLAIVK